MAWLSDIRSLANETTPNPSIMADTKEPFFIFCMRKNVFFFEKCIFDLDNLYSPGIGRMAKIARLSGSQVIRHPSTSMHPNAAHRARTIAGMWWLGHGWPFGLPSAHR
jgi:hypothetical protein